MINVALYFIMTKCETRINMRANRFPQTQYQPEHLKWQSPVNELGIIKRGGSTNSSWTSKMAQQQQQQQQTPKFHPNLNSQQLSMHKELPAQKHELVHKQRPLPQEPKLNVQKQSTVQIYPFVWAKLIRNTNSSNKHPEIVSATGEVPTITTLHHKKAKEQWVLLAHPKIRANIDGFDAIWMKTFSCSSKTGDIVEQYVKIRNLREDVDFFEHYCLSIPESKQTLQYNEQQNNLQEGNNHAEDESDDESDDERGEEDEEILREFIKVNQIKSQ